MVIKYSNIQTLKKLFYKKDLYNYLFNFALKKFNVFTISSSKNSNFELKFFRFFFWFFLLDQTKNSNFFLFYRKFKFALQYFKLLNFLKQNNLKYYNLFCSNKLLANRKLNYILLKKEILIVFVYNYIPNLNQNDKVIYIQNLNYKLVYLYSYFLTNIRE